MGNFDFDAAIFLYYPHGGIYLLHGSEVFLGLP